MYRIFITGLLHLLICCCAKTQVLLNKDSLLQLLPSIREDSAGVDYYISLGQQYENNEPERAKLYYRTARDISSKINYPAGFIKYVNNYTYVLNLQGLYDSSLLLNLEGVAMARHIKDSLTLAKTLVNTGTSYRNLSRLEEAVLYYEEGKKILEKFLNEELGAQLADILQLLYKELKQYDKAISYGNKAVDYFRKADNKLLLAFSLNNLGLAYVKKQDYQQGLKIFTETLSLGEALKDTTIISSSLLNLGDIYLKLGEYDKMEPFFRKAYLLNEKLDAQEQKVILLRALSLVEMSNKNYIKAKEYAAQSLTLAKQNGFLSEQQKTLETLSSIFYALHDMKTAEQYLQQATLIADSILNEMVTKNTIETEKRFESEKKELKISQLESEKELQRFAIQQKNTFNVVLMGGVVALLIITFLAYRNYRHKQYLQQQRITELETEKKLMATEAVLKGEEQERTRLAKDLHDGLGGMLSGIKHTMNAMKGNLIMTPDNAQAFERSMEMLDSSIQEMRRVAHNLMPEALVKFGLDSALKDFCNDINKSGTLRVAYQSIGLENEAIVQATAINIYRIVQELLHNTLKHAAATSAIVQVSKTENQFSITVEDDGKGFDTKVLSSARGIGWSNIRSRIDLLKGRLDIQSAPVRGTSVHIEFNI